MYYLCRLFQKSNIASEIPPGLFVLFVPIPFAYIGDRCGWASFLGGLVVWCRWRLQSSGFLGFFLWASDGDDVCCRNGLPLTGVVRRLRRFRVHCGVRYGAFLFSRI